MTMQKQMPLAPNRLDLNYQPMWQPDVVLIGSCLALLLFGLVMIASQSPTRHRRQSFDAVFARYLRCLEEDSYSIDTFLPEEWRGTYAREIDYNPDVEHELCPTTVYRQVLQSVWRIPDRARYLVQDSGGGLTCMDLKSRELIDIPPAISNQWIVRRGKPLVIAGDLNVVAEPNMDHSSYHRLNDQRVPRDSPIR